MAVSFLNSFLSYLVVLVVIAVVGAVAITLGITLRKKKNEAEEKKQTEEYSMEKSPDIIKYLENQGIHAERKSIYNDMECLADFGYDVVQVQSRLGGGYYLGSREFELPELKLLVDAVQSSRFITTKKSRELIRKL